MSAWMLQDELYTDLGATMENYIDRATNVCDFNYYFRAAFIENFGSDSVAEVLQKMYHQNAASYFYRYPKEKSTNDDYIFKYKSGKGKVLDLPQFLKHLACWEYQSCETPDYKTNAIYVAVKEFRRDICETIVTEHEAYKKAGWGEDRKEEKAVVAVG